MKFKNIFTLRRGSIDEKLKEGLSPLTDYFLIRATVESMRQETLIEDREACRINLYTVDPITLNGETYHKFTVFVPNHREDPRFNRDRMKFWMCYPHLGDRKSVV